MNVKNVCVNFPENKCLSSIFCNRHGCSRTGALNQSFEKSPIGSAFICIDGTFLIVNQSYSNILGYTVDELMNRTYIEITHKDDISKDVKKAEQITTGKITSYNMEKRYIKKDGSSVWVHLYVNGVFDEKNNFQYYVVHAIDIDFFKQQKDLTNFAAEVGGVGIWTWHEGSDELTWNQEMYDIYGIKRGTPIKYSYWAERIHPEDRKEAEELIWDSMTNGSIFNTYFRIIVDGKIKYIKAKASKTGSKPHRVLTGCNIDFTEFVEMKEKINKSTEELEYFTYSVSHDLKSPLVTLSGFSSIIGHELNDEEINWELIRDASNEIKKATQSLASTVDSILHLSRVGRIYIDKTHINTKNLVEEVLDLNSAKIEESQAKIINENNIDIFVQKEIFVSLIQNLIVNSIEHGKIEKQKLEIKINFEEDDSCFYLYFSDNGSGMSESQLENLFNYNNRQYAKGFGMMIIKKGIDFHRGKLDVKSELGKGTSFNVKFSKDNG